MGLIAKKTGEDFDFELCPAGNHLAVCFSVIDLGMQQSTYQGVVSLKRKVRISWELPNEKMTKGEFEGQPFSISKNYTLSLSEKAILYKDLISWRGRAFTADELNGFDLFNVLGAACMVNVTHTPKDNMTYANVASVSQLPKGMTKPALVNPLRKLSLDEFDQSVYDGLPEWLQQKINLSGRSAPEQPQPQSNSGFYDDDIPF